MGDLPVDALRALRDLHHCEDYAYEEDAYGNGELVHDDLSAFVRFLPDGLNPLGKFSLH